jgi:hypothetical protein
MTETRRAILQTLEAMSDRYPEMRFGQLVANISNWATRKPDALWDVEDETFLQAITSHLNRTAGADKERVESASV